MRSTGSNRGNRRITGTVKGNQDEKKPVRNWGQGQAGYLAALKGKQVTVVFLDGKALKGELTGVDTYELFVRQSNDLEVMVAKGAVKYLHPSANG